MFDARLRSLIDPPLQAAGRRIARAGIPADAVTITGFAFGLIAALAIANGLFLVGLALIALNRAFDGLDGAVARALPGDAEPGPSASGPSDRGGYLDIVLDFVFYGAVPLAFAVADPARNALAAAVLLFTFTANGSAFLAFAVFAERRKLATAAQGPKSLYYLSGLAEGGETIAAFMLMCLVPAWFPAIAAAFAMVCGLSAAARIVLAASLLGPD
ncbi:CDP-alcohol phosphatidyltransferase family protein [Amorphus sp. 3PC139-8]|uniref:CDP-alcohol phosphatidyltransferase family protein n=1 Tax=Amorphus sp. 3PC139-8 TaxID=2735676 RepID=UPI00345CCEA7